MTNFEMNTKNRDYHLKILKCHIGILKLQTAFLENSIFVKRHVLHAPFICIKELTATLFLARRPVRLLHVKGYVVRAPHLMQQP